MECKKYFQFEKRKFSQNGIASFYLSGSGSFVITAPDLPLKAEVVPPQQDEKIVEELLEVLFGDNDAESATINNSDVKSYADFPRYPEVIAKWINEENTPLRWKQKTGYRLKELSFSAFYPSDEQSTVRAGFVNRIAETEREMSLIIEKEKTLVPGCYHVNASGIVEFDWDKIGGGSTEFWTLTDKYNLLFNKEIEILKEFADYKLNEIDRITTLLNDLSDQLNASAEKLKEGTEKIKQSKKSGIPLDPKELEYYDNINLTNHKMYDEAAVLKKEFDELTEEYKALCKILGECR